MTCVDMTRSAFEHDTEQEAIARLYDAALGDAPWNRALDAVGRSVGATSVVLFSDVPGTRTSIVLGSVSLDAEAAEPAQPPVPAIVRHDHALCVLAAADTPAAESLMPSRPRVDDGWVPTFSLWAFRTREHVAFGTREHDVFGRVQVHFRRVARIAAHGRIGEALSAAWYDLAEPLGCGVALLDASGRVLHANGVFERMCAAGDGLAAPRRTLAATGPSAARLLQLIADTLGGAPGGCLDVVRPSGRPPYRVRVTPLLRAVPAIGLNIPRVSVVAEDPAVRHEPSELALQRRYGLTRAEARLVARLLDGATVGDTAAQLGISLNTARTHLKHAMAKAGVSRQVELVRLLLSQS